MSESVPFDFAAEDDSRVLKRLRTVLEYDAIIVDCPRTWRIPSPKCSQLQPGCVDRFMIVRGGTFGANARRMAGNATGGCNGSTAGA
jgi:hypothetical protein